MPDPEKDLFRRNNLLIRHYFGVNPDKLTDEKWAMMAKDAEWLLKVEQTMGRQF